MKGNQLKKIEKNQTKIQKRVLIVSESFLYGFSAGLSGGNSKFSGKMLRSANDQSFTSVLHFCVMFGGCCKVL